jgi:galactofuranosylgalactofuranosylrhamnosyl-N-acetylglucosaminyl-diphospho-decaprenol beta-1,5/1,6-galactofuranosyltransferase
VDDQVDDVIWRAVFPHPGDEDAAALYVRSTGAKTSRHGIMLDPGGEFSLATYFGAFPAGYWRHWTGLSAVRLEFEVSGRADIVVRRSDVAGRVTDVVRLPSTTGAVGVDLSVAEDEGWIWLEAVATSVGADLRDIVWRSSTPLRRGMTATVAITTFDREADCLALLGRFASDRSWERSVDRILVVDQGTRPLTSADGFAHVERALGARLRIVRQANLGGSGGFSRGMVDAVEETDSSFVLLLDDDVRLEPEAIARLLSFASRTTESTIVGAHMLSLVDRTRLHSFGERVSRRGFWWGPAEPALSEIDLAANTVDNTPTLSRRIDVDFNGWWMCLLPSRLIRESGASLPFFIKWDDAEVGLRAKALGIPTVTLPGAALWHMPWTAKDDGLDWQAYFQLRNRIVTALLHGGRGVLASSLAQDVNHVLCAQYGSVRVRNTALRDVLSGPGHLEPVLFAGPPRASAILAEAGQRMIPAGQAPVGRRETPHRPLGSVATAVRAIRVVGHQLRSSRQAAATVRLSRAGGKWWSIGLRDVVVVESSAAGGVFVFRRDRRVAWSELRTAMSLRVRLWWGWRRLARHYGEAAPSLASPEAWRARFAESDSQAP